LLTDFPGASGEYPQGKKGDKMCASTAPRPVTIW
jgi:hypothetical protein